MRVSGVAMGAESDFGEWDRKYSPLFSFEIRGKSFLFGQQLSSRFFDHPNTCRWFIQELHSDGKLGDETDSGWWNNHYAVQFPFTIGDGDNQRVFFYGQNLETRYWFIQELKPDGKLGDETDNGKWNNAYAVQFPFTIGKRVFFFGHNVGTHYWFIQEIKEKGKMGSETCNGRWASGYDVMFPFKVGGEQYIYGQDIHPKGEGRWFIQGITTDGKLGDVETDQGHWAGKYPVQVPYYIDRKPYFFGQGDEKNWFIQSLKEKGKMGDELAHGTWTRYYGDVATFSAGGKHWLFGLDAYNWWTIRQLNSAEVVFDGA